MSLCIRDRMLGASLFSFRARSLFCPGNAVINYMERTRVCKHPSPPVIANSFISKASCVAVCCRFKYRPRRSFDLRSHAHLFALYYIRSYRVSFDPLEKVFSSYWTLDWRRKKVGRKVNKVAVNKVIFFMWIRIFCERIVTRVPC